MPKHSAKGNLPNLFALHNIRTAPNSRSGLDDEWDMGGFENSFKGLLVPFKINYLNNITEQFKFWCMCV